MQYEPSDTNAARPPDVAPTTTPAGVVAGGQPQPVKFLVAGGFGVGKTKGGNQVFINHEWLFRDRARGSGCGGDDPGLRRMHGPCPNGAIKGDFSRLPRARVSTALPEGEGC